MGVKDSPVNICGIIPARGASTRFPNKPMAKIIGMPMIGHVFYRSSLCTSLDQVWVATCDQDIFDYGRSTGGKAVMTAATHERASDRAAEAMVCIEELSGARIDAVALIQGDEPMLVPSMIDDLVQAAAGDTNAEVVNLVAGIESDVEFEDLNVVKVVADLNGYALYYSREPIPSKRRYKDQVPMRKQLGLILFTRDALLAYADMEPTPLEIIESVDMNRLLEYGHRIKLAETTHVTRAVDTEADLAQVEVLLREDPLLPQYLAR